MEQRDIAGAAPPPPTGQPDAALPEPRPGKKEKRVRRSTSEVLADKVANLGLTDLKKFRTRLAETNDTALKLLAGESVKLE